jgi:DNA-binding response OmpR family regulator
MFMKQRILIVEDDAGLARVLRDNLEFEGFDVANVTDGNLAVRRAQEFVPDLILLDVALPGKNGFELCGLLRATHHASIIILTARGQKDDKLRGLSLGADDYVTKPFDLEELLARIHAVLRRARTKIQCLTLERVTIDFQTLQAWEDGRRLELTHREFELLRYLAERQEIVVSRDELLRRVWGYSETPDTRAVDYAVVRLRRKIEPDARHPRFIRTVHGDGYCLTTGPMERED